MNSRHDRKERKRRTSYSPPRERKRKLSDEEKPHHKKDDQDRDRRDRRGDANRRGRPKSFKDKRSEDVSKYDWGKKEIKQEKPDVPVEKEKPNFEISGKLAEDTNTFNGIVVKYSEPEEARKPKRRWRLYRFKGEEEFPFIPLHRQSAYLFGRSRQVADVPIDHPSCSKQHAVLQFRLTPFQREDGTKGRRVRPYIIDLDSANGTFVNNNKIDGRRYVELIEKDVVKFGFSSREYVLLHEESKEDEEDEDIELEQEPAND